jgi:hypothetical protein
MPTTRKAPPLKHRVVWNEIDREARKGKPVPSDQAPLVIDIDSPGIRSMPAGPWQIHELRHSGLSSQCNGQGSGGTTERHRAQDGLTHPNSSLV